MVSPMVQLLIGLIPLLLLVMSVAVRPLPAARQVPAGKETSR